MLYLKPANFDDLDAEYEYVKEMPVDENGFINDFYCASKEDFEKIALPKMINYSKGIDLPEGFVPETFFFLWNMDSFEKKEEEPAPAAPTTKVCPYCRSEIAIEATRCPHCTSEVE